MRNGFLIILIGALSISPAWGDILHFQSGQSLQGKVNRMTGDLIEFQREGSGFWGLGHAEMIKRVDLNNRNDQVKTRDQKIYTGEIIYIDTFTVELKTETGNLRLPRYQVRDINLGIPSQLGEQTAPNRLTRQDPNPIIPVSLPATTGVPAHTPMTMPTEQTSTEKTAIYQKSGIPAVAPSSAARKSEPGIVPVSDKPRVHFPGLNEIPAVMTEKSRIQIE